MNTHTVKFTDIDKALENDSDTSDLVVLRKALRIAVDALGKKEER